MSGEDRTLEIAAWYRRFARDRQELVDGDEYTIPHYDESWDALLDEAYEKIDTLVEALGITPQPAIHTVLKEGVEFRVREGHGRATFNVSETGRIWNPNGDPIPGPATVTYIQTGDGYNVIIEEGK